LHTPSPPAVQPSSAPPPPPAWPKALLAPVERWAFWAFPPSTPGRAVPELGFVEPLLRRRLSLLAKTTLLAAHECAHNQPGVRFVYASRHGELAKTTGMLENLAENEGVSPLAFSLAVLNASAGLFSMVHKNHAPATAVSAGKASFGYGLLQACMQWAQCPEIPVLFVYADEVAPAVYEEVEPPGSQTRALALLLSDKASRKIHCTMSACTQTSSQEAQESAFMRCLREKEAIWSHAGVAWHWFVEGE